MFLIVPQLITLRGNCKIVLQRYEIFSRKAKNVAYIFLHFLSLRQLNSYTHRDTQTFTNHTQTFTDATTIYYEENETLE